MAEKEEAKKPAKKPAARKPAKKPAAAKKPQAAKAVEPESRPPVEQATQTVAVPSQPAAETAVQPVVLDGYKPVGAVMVIGGGIGGVQASLDLVEMGYRVYLVDSGPSIGGVMGQLDHFTIDLLRLDAVIDFVVKVTRSGYADLSVPPPAVWKVWLLPLKTS